MNIDGIENSIVDARARIERAERLDELRTNPLYIEFVEKGFFQEEALRMVTLYGSGSLDDEGRAALERDMHSVGFLKAFFAHITAMGRQAKSDLEVALGQREMAYAMQREEELLEVDPNYNGSLGA